MKYDLIVIGSGPGGYVAAIRAAQLGMNVAVVERAELGGICLNWGCIPTKSLLKSAQVLDYARHAEAYGVQVTEAQPDFNAIIARSRGVAEKMSKGIQYLFKKNNITVLEGNGKLTSDKKVEVTDNTGVSQLTKLSTSFSPRVPVPDNYRQFPRTGNASLVIGKLSPWIICRLLYS